MAPRDVVRKLRSVVKELFKRSDVQDLINNVTDLEACMTFLIDEDSLTRYADELKGFKKDAAAAFKLFSKIRGKSKVAEEASRVFEEEFDSHFPGLDADSALLPVPSKKRGRGEEEGSGPASSAKRNDVDKSDKEVLKGIIRSVAKLPDAEVFLHPVSAEVFPEYYQVIKTPRDLTSVLEKVSRAPLQETLEDVRLVWDNCKTYNAEGSAIYEAAHKLSEFFEEQVAALLGEENTRSTSLTLTLPASAKAKTPLEPREAKRAMLRVLSELKKSAFAEPFLEPVRQGEAPGYSDVVTRPMDISAVEAAVRDGTYGADLSAFRADVSLIWTNCLAYNDESSRISDFARQLKSQFYDLWGRSSFLQALASTGKDRARMRSALDAVVRCPLSEPFRLPVDLAGAPGYAEAIAVPMDLSTVAARLDSYASPQDFASDVRLIFRNCEQYNDEGSQLVATARACGRLFEEELERGREKAAPEPSKDRKRAKAEPKVEPKVEPDPEKKPEASRRQPRPSRANVVNENEPWSVDSDSTGAFRVSKLTEDNLDALLLQLQAPEALVSFFVRSRAHKRAREAATRLVDYAAVDRLPIELPKPSGLLVTSLGELPLCSSSKRRPGAASAFTPVIPAFYKSDQLMPLGFSAEQQLRLAVYAAGAEQKKAPFVDTVFRSRIACEGEGDRRKPVFEVSCENTVVATGPSAREAWDQLSLGVDPRIFKVLGGRLWRCRAVLNRLCASQRIVPFLEQMDVDSEQGRDYYQVVRAPMWLREIHRRLLAGTYDWEFDFAWDVRLVFQNCMSYNLPGSELYLTAERLLAFFEELFCQWVLNVQDARIDDLARGSWDAWAYLKYFDEPAGLDDHFCTLSKRRLPEDALIMCSACDDQYEMAAVNIQRVTNTLVKTWLCQRCTEARDFSFLSLDPPSPSILQYSPYSKLHFGEQMFLPAPHIGPGWFQARLADSSSLDDLYLSPLGERFRGGELVQSQVLHEAAQNKELLKEREKEFFGKGVAAKKKRRRGGSKKKTPAAGQAEEHAAEEQALSCGALYSYEPPPGAGVHALIPFAGGPKDGHLELREAHAADPAGADRRLADAADFFGRNDSQLQALLEGHERAVFCEGYVFNTAPEEQKRAVAECKAEKTRRRTKGILEVRSVRRVARERWQWEISKAQHCYFHSPAWEGVGMDVDEEQQQGVAAPADVDDESPIFERPYDYTEQMQPLLPVGMTSAHGEALLAVWDMLATCSSAVGELSVTFADMLRCADPPPSAAHASPGQVVFDEVCASLTQLLLVDLKKLSMARNDSVTDLTWEVVYLTKPINILSWPHVLLAVLHARDKALSDKEVLSVMLHGPSTDDIARRSLLLALGRHPDVREASARSPPFKEQLAAVRARAYFDPEEDGDGAAEPFASVAEMVLELRRALEELAQRPGPFLLDNALNAMQWLSDECRRVGVDGGGAESHGSKLSTVPAESLAKDSSLDRALDLFLNDGFKLPAFINPFDFGNRTALALAGLEEGSDARKELERRGGLAEVDCLARSLQLLASSDPDSWSREQRIGVLSSLTSLCAATDLVKNSTDKGDRRTIKVKRFADISDIPPVPMLPTSAANFEFVPKVFIKEGFKCFFTEATLSAADACVYVPENLLKGQEVEGSANPAAEGALGTRGSLLPPVTSEATLLRVLAAIEYSRKQEAAMKRQYELVLAESPDQKAPSRVVRPTYERAMPVGYDRHGSQFWLFDAQQDMPVGDLHEVAKADEEARSVCPEPYLLVKKRDGRWYKLPCGWPTFSKFLQQLDSGIPCELVLQRCAAERLSFTRATLYRHALSPHGAQVDWLQRMGTLLQWLSKWTLPSTSIDTKEQMKQLEIYWSRLCELRCFVHTYLLLDEKDERERSRPVNADPSREREAVRKRIFKLRTLWAEDFFDAHNYKGFLRSDHLSKIRQLGTTTAATFIHYNFEYFKLYCENMVKCTEPYAHLQMLHDERMQQAQGEREEEDEEQEKEVPVVDPNDNTPLAGSDTPTGAAVDAAAANAAATATDDEPLQFEAPAQAESARREPPQTFGHYVSHKKMVEQLHPETGEVLRVYPSGKYAATFMQVSQGGISQCCNGNCQEFCGFKWRFYTGPPLDFVKLEGTHKPYEEIMAAIGQGGKRSFSDITRKIPLPQTVASPRPSVAPTAVYSGGVQMENPSEPRVHAVLAVDVMSVRLVRLKAELLSILYIAPIRKVKFVNLPPDSEAELAAAANDKVKRKELRRGRRARGQALFIEELRAATTPAQVMRLVKLLERMLITFVVCHNSDAMPREDAATCGEVAANIFALDRALRYDAPIFEDKHGRPSVAGSVKSQKPRTAFVPRCVFSFSCTSYFGHPGKVCLRLPHPP